MTTEELIDLIERRQKSDGEDGLLRLCKMRLIEQNEADEFAILSYIYDIRCIIEKVPGKLRLPELLARIRELHDANSWRPISEAKRDGTKYDVLTEKARVQDVFWYHDWKSWVHRNVDCECPCYETIHPTHFRPLPAPPQKEGE